MLLSSQAQLILSLTILCTNAVKPPGYVQPAKAPDPNPPKYEYGYKISDETGSGQGKQEQRDGIYALGRYYVQQKGANQDIRYFADDWGYHPVVEYSSVGPHSRSTTQFALGTEAVQQLKNKENNRPQLQGILNGNERLGLASGPEGQDVPTSSPSQQTILQPGYQIYVTPPQPELQQQEVGPNFQVQSSNTGQESVQPTLLLGEYQSQPLTGQAAETRADSKQQIVTTQINSQSQQQNQDSIQNLDQQSQQPLQGILQQQYLQQSKQGVVQRQNDQDQVQQVTLRHEEPTQQLIFPQENQQLVHVQQQIQQEESPRQVQLFFPLQQQQQQQTDVQENKYESAALFQSSDNQLVTPQSVTATDRYQNDEVEASLRTYNGNFGSRITAKGVVDTTNKLIEHTKNLVTGEDVLNINQAISQDHNINEETSTPQSALNVVSENIITNVVINHADGIYSTTTASPTTEASLNDQPIVVEDLEENISQTTAKSVEVIHNSEEERKSSTSETIVSSHLGTTAPSTVLVTPRPVSTNFLAPITAGVRLQNIEFQGEDEQKSSNKEKYNVEIQQSLPYYLGKFEYPMSAYAEQQIVTNETVNETIRAELRATENIELGKTLLFFPEQSIPQVELKKAPLLHQQPLTEVSNHINVQQLPSSKIKESFVEVDQQQAQGYQHHVTIQHSGGESNYATQSPTEITKIIHKPYPVKVPYEVPYPVVKQVQVPVTVERIVEKPIHITKYIEKPIPIPQPYPVEKVVEKPIHVPVQVTKYIDRPYPVEVRVPYPQPYPVEKVVQKIVKQPYPVEVRVPVHVEKIVEKKVPVPHYVQKPVEKIVEKPVPHYVDRPYPVEVKVPVPQPYIIRVEVPKPYQSQASQLYSKSNAGQVAQGTNLQFYNVPSLVNVPQHLLIQPLNLYTQSYSGKNTEPHTQSSQPQTYFYANPYAYAPQVNYYLPPKQEITLNNGYLPPLQTNSGYLPPKKDCDLDQQNQDTNQKSLYHAVKPDDYIGLLPPKADNSQLKYLKKYRSARSSFDEKNIRMEYGFMPPLIPSLEIDEQGNPIDKGDK